MFSNLGKQYFLPGQYFVSVIDAIGGTDLAYHLVSAVDPFADGQQSIPGWTVYWTGTLVEAGAVSSCV